MQEIQVPPLGPEDPLEKEMATHLNIPAWKILWTRGTWWATVHGAAERWTWLSYQAQRSCEPLEGLNVCDSLLYVQ